MKPLLAATLLLALTLPAQAATAHHLSDAQLRRLDAPLAAGARVHLESVAEIDGKSVAADVEAFDVWAPGATIAVQENGKVRHLAPPRARMYRGALAGDADSLVFLTSDERGVNGLVVSGARRFDVIAAPGGAMRQSLVREASPLDDAPADFSCGVEGGTKNPMNIGVRSLSPLTGTTAALTTSTATYHLNVAIDTDYELYQRLGSLDAVTKYITNIVGAASIVYQRDLRATLSIAYLGVQLSSNDPFDVVPGSVGTWNGVQTSLTTDHALFELGDRWHNTPPSVAPHSAVVMMSGKANPAGLAWLATMCDSDFVCQSGFCGDPLFDNHWGGRYAYCGYIGFAGTGVPDPLANDGLLPSVNYWALFAFCHELGHVAGSDHTHCTQLGTADAAKYGRTYVDYCANEGGCYSGPTSTPPELGTIMSYCHHRSTSSGTPATRYLFGKAGEASEFIQVVIRDYLDSVHPRLSAITAPTTATVGVAATAQVADNGAAFAWEIVNGTLSASDTAAVTFTPTATPVTLRVTATSRTTGCATSDTIVIPGVSCAYDAPVATAYATKFGGSGTLPLNTTCSWTAVSESPFITVTSAASGSGSARIGYTVAPNATGAERTGSILYGTKRTTIRQSAAGPLRGDLNGDFVSDRVWEDGAGKVYVTLSGANGAAPAYVTTVGSGYRLQGVGDFDRDGRSDLIWVGSGGDVWIWLMDGATIRSSTSPYTVAPNYAIAAVADFDGNGRADILWFNQVTGDTYLWLMNGTAIGTSNFLYQVAANYFVAAVGDFDGDDRADIFWMNRATGDTYVWLMNGAALRSSTYIYPVATNYAIAGVSDFDGDRRADLFWLNAATGDSYVWQMNGATIAASTFVYQVAPGFAALGATPNRELLWRSRSAATIYTWTMNGPRIVSSSADDTIPADWTLLAPRAF